MCIRGIISSRDIKSNSIETVEYILGTPNSYPSRWDRVFLQVNELIAFSVIGYESWYLGYWWG